MKQPFLSMNYEFFALTHPGQVRENNEDAVSVDSVRRIVVLADGMGGYNAGEIASGMAISVVNQELGQWLDTAGASPASFEVRRAMALAVDKANTTILDAANTNIQFAGMGTTLVVGVFCVDKLILGHIGDSRCYRLRDGILQQITRDHSWLQEQVDAGLITPQQAASSANRNLVTRALGVEPEVMLELNEFIVAPGDQFLLCSDGLTDMVADEPLAHLMTADNHLPTKATALVDAANASGGRDNISVLLAKASPPEKKKSLFARLMSAKL